MDEIQNKNEENTRDEKKTEALFDSICRGEMELKKPIRAGSADIEKLKYDFTRLTGWEYAQAMDKDREGRGAFYMTAKQAISLFAAAAAKETKGLDEVDIISRMGMEDGVKAVQLAQLFLNLSARVEKKST